MGLAMPRNADEITARVPGGTGGRSPGRGLVRVPRGRGEAAPPSHDQGSGASRPTPQRARTRPRPGHAPRYDPLDRDRALPRITRAEPTPRGRSGEPPRDNIHGDMLAADPESRGKNPEKSGRILSMGRRGLRPNSVKFLRRCVSVFANLKHSVSRGIAPDLLRPRTTSIQPWRIGSPAFRISSPLEGQPADPAPGRKPRAVLRSYPHARA